MGARVVRATTTTTHLPLLVPWHFIQRSHDSQHGRQHVVPQALALRFVTHVNISNQEAMAVSTKGLKQ
jgi:hypothetical protein